MVRLETSIRKASKTIFSRSNTFSLFARKYWKYCLANKNKMDLKTLPCFVYSSIVSHSRIDAYRERNENTISVQMSKGLEFQEFRRDFSVFAWRRDFLARSIISSVPNNRGQPFSQSVCFDVRLEIWEHGERKAESQGVEQVEKRCKEKWKPKRLPGRTIEWNKITREKNDTVDPYSAPKVNREFLDQEQNRTTRDSSNTNRNDTLCFSISR